jgi:hypothetical protein
VIVASPLFWAPYSWTIAVRTVNPTNERGNSRVAAIIKSKRAAEQRAMVRMVIGSCVRGLYPCTVTLTRIGPKRLDDDNLAGALKAVRDAVADALGCDDADTRVKFLYAQERGATAKEYAVRIEVRPTERL